MWRSGALFVFVRGVFRRCFFFGLFLFVDFLGQFFLVGNLVGLFADLFLVARQIVALQEAVDATFGVDELLFARVERMSEGADVEGNDIVFDAVDLTGLLGSDGGTGDDFGTSVDAASSGCSQYIAFGGQVENGYSSLKHPLLPPRSLPRSM